ncbi:MAG: hypothetical protein II070_11755 [Treponema sp.]|nr:hypothetical protein [Treponema sp.]
MEKDTDSNSELNKYGVWIKTPPRTAKEGDVEMLAPAEGEVEVAEQDYSMPDFKFLNDQAELAAAADKMDEEDQPLKDIELPPDIVIPSQDTDLDLSAFDDELTEIQEPLVEETLANESSDDTFVDEPTVVDEPLADEPTFVDEPTADESSVEAEANEPFANEPLTEETIVKEENTSSGDPESDGLSFETVPAEDISVEEEGSNILEDGVTTEIDVNSFMDESAPVKREASEDEEVSIDDFLDGSDSTPDGDVSINEFISSNSTNPIGEQDNFVPDGEISLDAFLDSPIESSQTEQKQEEEVFDDPIDIDLSFDDTLKVETEENSELDDILDDFTSQDSSSVPSASAGESVDLDSFFSDDSQKESGAAPKKSVSMEDTTEAISADDFDSMFAPSDSQEGQSQSVDLSDFGIGEDESQTAAKAIPQKKPDFDLKVSSDGSLEENSAEGIAQETEDDNISIYMDDTSKNQIHKEAPVKTENTAQDDDFDLDSLLDSIEDESGKTVSIGNEASPTPAEEATSEASTSDKTVTEGTAAADDATLAAPTVTESDFDAAEETAITESDIGEAEDTAVDGDASLADGTEGGDDTFPQPDVFDQSEFVPEEDNALGQDFKEEDQTFPQDQAPGQADENIAKASEEEDATLADPDAEDSTLAQEESTESFSEPDVFEGTEFLPEEDNAVSLNFQEAGQEKSLPQESKEEFNPFSEETVETVFEEADLEDPSLPSPVSEDTISYSTEEAKAPQDGENISIASFLGSEDFEDPIDSMVQKELKVQAEEEEKLKKDIDESANSVENSTIDNEGVEPETTGEGNMDNAIDNNELLTQIVDDLKEVKNEISNLKSEFEEFKRNGAGSESEEVIEPVVEPIPNDGDKGFFGDEDDDDTIALSGDELTNILSSAEMTSENSDGEQELEAPSSSADARESVQTEEDILGSAESMPEVPNDYNQEDTDSDVDFGNESLEEPNLDEVEIGASAEEESDASEESDAEEEIEVPKVDDILVESSNSDFIENAITGDVPAPAEESEGEFTESQDFEEPLVGEEELKAEAEEQSERLAAELSEADDDNSEDEDSSDTTPEMDQILATIHQENMEKDKIHPEVYSESEESEESPLEEPVAPQVNEPEKELDIEALKTEALEEFDEPEVVENDDIENESSVEVEYVPATGGDPFANEEKPELTEDNIEFLKEDEDEKIEPGISEEPVTKVFNGWENPDNTDEAISEEEAVAESAGAEEAETVAEEPALEASEPEVADEVPGASGLSAAALASSGNDTSSSEETDAPAEAIPEELKEEIKTVLSYMDQLLENLPEEKIEEFARSEQFSTYKKLFKELGLS